MLLRNGLHRICCNPCCINTLYLRTLSTASQHSNTPEPNVWTQADIDALLQATLKYKPRSHRYLREWHDMSLDRDLNIALHDKLHRSQNPAVLLRNKYRDLYYAKKLPKLDSNTTINTQSVSPPVKIRRVYRAIQRNAESNLSSPMRSQLNTLCERLTRAVKATDILWTINEIRTLTNDRMHKLRWILMFDVLIKHQQFDTAYILFQRSIEALELPAIVLYTDYIKILIDNKEIDKAFTMLTELHTKYLNAANIDKSQYQPDITLYTVMLKGLQHNATQVVQFFHDIINRDIVPDNQFYNIVLLSIQHDNTLTRQQHITLTIQILRHMQKQHEQLNASQYNILLHTFAKYLEDDECRTSVLQLYESMRCSGIIADLSAYRQVITLYQYISDIDSAERVFYYIQSLKLKPDVRMYNQMLSMYIEHKRKNHMLHLLRQMLHNNIQFNLETYNTILQYYNNATSQHFIAAKVLALHIYRYMNECNKLPSAVTYKLLINILTRRSSNAAPCPQSVYQTKSLQKYIDRFIETPYLHTYISAEYPCATLIKYRACDAQTYCPYSHDLKHNTYAQCIATATERLNAILSSNARFNVLRTASRHTLIAMIPSTLTLEQVTQYFQQFDSVVKIKSIAPSDNCERYKIHFSSIETYNMCLYDNVYPGEVPRIHTIDDILIDVLPYTHNLTYERRNDPLITTEQIAELQQRCDNIVREIDLRDILNPHSGTIKLSGNRLDVELPQMTTRDIIVTDQIINELHSMIWLAMRYVKKYRQVQALYIKYCIRRQYTDVVNTKVLTRYIHDKYDIRTMVNIDQSQSDDRKQVGTIVVTSNQLMQYRARLQKPRFKSNVPSKHTTQQNQPHQTDVQSNT